MTVGAARTTEIMRRAITRDTVQAQPPARIADVACGKGAAACDLARALGCNALAFDLHPAFLRDAQARVRDQARAARDTAFAAELEAAIAGDWQAAQTGLGYFTLVARRA